MDKASLGKKIREARIKKGYTQQTLSEKADIGEMYLSEIERGVKMPSMNLFIKLITALDISADYVLRDEIPTGKEFVYDEITQKLEGLTPKQRKAAADILDAYIRNLERIPSGGTRCLQLFYCSLTNFDRFRAAVSIMIQANSIIVTL